MVNQTQPIVWRGEEEASRRGGCANREPRQHLGRDGVTVMEGGLCFECRMCEMKK